MRPKEKTSEARTALCRNRRRRIPTGFSRSLSTLALSATAALCSLLGVSCESTQPDMVPSPPTSPSRSTLPTGSPSTSPGGLVTTELGTSSNSSLGSIAVDPTERRIYTVDPIAGTLFALDSQTLTLGPVVRGFTHAERVAVDRQSHEIFIAAAGGRIWRVEPRTFRVIDSAEIVSRGSEDVNDLVVDPQARRLYVLMSGSGVWALDLFTLRVRDRIGESGLSLCLDPSRSRLYLADRRRVGVIDTARFEVIDEFGLGGTSIAVDPTTNELYLARPGRDIGVLEIVDAGTGQSIASLRNGVWPTDVEIDTETGLVYVVDQGALNIESVDPDAGLVWVVDLEAHSLRSTLSVGIAPDQAALDARTGAMYLADPNAATISLFFPS